MVTIRDIKTICTAPEGINLLVVKVETSEPGLYGLGCGTFAYRHLAVKLVVEEYLRPLFQYIREGEYVYYVHSYYGKNCTESTLATSEYSIPVTGAVRAGKVYGTQFHPEKSGDTGLRILKAFAEL